MFVLSFLVFLVCMSIVTCRSYSFPKATSGPDQGQPIADSDQTILPSDRAGKCEVFDPCVFSCINPIKLTRRNMASIEIQAFQELALTVSKIKTRKMLTVEERIVGLA